MNTPTHVIAAAALLSRKDSPKRNWAVFIGALVPDVSIYVMSAWAVATGRMNQELWEVVYWTEPWQTLGAITNSAPLALGLLGVGLWRKWTLLWVFAAALLVHGALDFPVHADDAHRHFWPLSDWRFHSPLSYWNTDHHGQFGRLLDVGLMLAGIAVLWRRFDALWLRIVLAVFAALGALVIGLSVWSALT